MLKYIQKHYKELILALVVFFVLCVIVVTSQSFQHCICQSDSYHSDHLLKELFALFQCLGSFLETNGETIGALSTCVIAFFTYTLWRSTSEQARLTTKALKLARDEFNSTHRPKIRIRSIWLVSSITIDSPILVNLIVVNVGDTKALVERYAVTTCFVTKGDSIPLSIEEFPVYEAPVEIGRGVRHPFKDLSVGQSVTTEEFNAIRLGDKVLYCIGWIRYRDEAGNPMQTGFCKTFTIHRHDAIQIHGGFFREQNEDFEYED